MSIQTSFFCMQILNCPTTICRKEYSFPTEWSGILVENQLTINIRIYFWTCSSIPLIKPVPHSLDYCSLVLHFEIGKYKSSSAEVAWGIHGHLNFHMNFKTRLLISAEQTIETLICRLIWRLLLF